MKFFQLTFKNDCQINTNRSNKRFGYFLTFLLLFCLSANPFEATAQHCGGATTTLAKWDFNSLNIQCNGAQHLGPTPITDPSITPGATYCPNINNGCSATTLGSVGHQNTPQFQNAVCLFNFYNVEAVLAKGLGAPFDPNSTVFDPNAKVNLSVWYDLPKNTEGCLDNFQLKVLQKQFNGSQLNFETQGVAVKRNGVLIFTETQTITTAHINGQAFTYNFSGSDFCSDGSEEVAFEIVFGLVHRLIGPALPGTPGQTGYDDICVSGSCKKNAFGGILPATCGPTSPNDDAGVLIQNFAPGNRYDYNEGTTYTGSATFASGSTEVPADGIIPNFPNPATATDYSFRVFQDGCHSDFTVNLEPKYCCVIPTGGLLAATPATCDGTTANSDAQIVITGVSGGTKTGISSGNTYTGPDFASANTLTGGEFTFTGLSNPLVAQTYTVRVYKDATCFVDFQTALFNETCIVPCTQPNGVTLTSTMATCAGTTKNTDAIIQVTNVNGGDRVGMSPSITYSGPDYDTALDLVNGSYTFSGIDTPDGTQIYTVRVFNTSDGCYIDETIEIEDPECGPCKHPSAFVISVGENVGEGDGTNNQTSYESCQTPGFIDIELTKTASSGTATTYVSNGTPFDWTISIENKGNITATDVNVIDLIPAGLSVTANNPSKGTFYGGSGWEVGDLAANETATLTISTMALLNGTYTNCAYVNSALPENDPDSSPNNTEAGNEDDDDCAEITITGNNTPSIEQSFSPMLTSTEEPTRLTIKIRNNHTEPITTTTDLVDPFPSSPGQMSIAPTPNLYVSAGITPGGSGIIANPNGTELTIPAGTVLQPGLNEITVDLIAPVLGDYMVGIDVDELMTNIGGNYLPSEAMIKANPAFEMAPVVTVRMEPEIIIIGQTTNMVITIQNMNGTPMSLNQNFENEFPTGLIIDGPITSTGPTPFLQNNDTGINIPAGTVIDPNSTYTVSIPFTINTPGTYSNTVNMNQVLTTVGSNNYNGNEDVAEATVRAVICPELTLVQAQESGTTITTMCSGESVDLKITHSSQPGNIAIYSSSNASLTATELYDFTNHAANGISVVNANVSPDVSATMTVESNLSPTDTITYYVILAEGHNLIIAPVCLPFQSATINVNPPTPTAALISGPVDVCSEDSRFVTGTENVVNLTSYISTGDVSGVWTSNAPGGALVGNVFTATRAMEGNTYTFTYTLAGNMPGSGTSCDDNVYMIDINVVDCYASLGDKVWEDKDGNGIQDENTSVEGVAVTLYACESGVKGAPIETLYTDANGNYLFTELLPGEYCVKFDLSTSTHPSVDDFKFTAQNSTVSGSDDTNTSDANPTDGCTESYSLSAGDEELDVDAGVYIPAKLGDLVWEDINYNGVQDANEPGIEDVTVTLTGTNGLGEPVGPIALQTTNVGMYMFGDLKPGEYVVTFEQPNGYVQTPTDDPNTNGDDESDSDANTNLQSPVTTILSGDTIPNVDAGFLVLGKIGDFAWQDYDADGVQDSNEDPFENIELTLTGTDNMNNPVTEIISTDANGKYCFTDVYPGTYIVTCGLPTDLVQTILEEPTSNEEDDSDFNPNTNQTTPLVLVSKDTFLYVDCGFFGQDFGDAPNTFETREAQNGPAHVIQPGKYLGTGVDAEVNGKPQATSGYTGTGGDDNAPSNYEKGTNPTGDENGVTFITPMIPGHEACIKIVTTATSGDNYLTGWIDFDGNGSFESTDQLLWKTASSTTPDLLVTNGATEATYCFDVPTDATFNGGETHSRFRLSCETGVQPTGRVIGGEVEDYYEAFAKIGNLVWRDYEFEGDQDEPTYDGFNGVEVQLVWEGLDGILGNADDVTYSTMTSEIDGENGKYCFFGAVPGDYTVRIPTIPAGFEPTQSNMTGDENNDSDGLTVDFTIAEDFNLPEGENGMTDNPTGYNYPDKQDNLQFDFGFIAFDYGDLPAGFPTKDADTEEGAHHSIIPCMYLGNAVDSEEDGSNDAYAGTDGTGGDDNTLSNFIEGTLTGTSDEDGVEFITPLVPGAEAKIKVTAKAPAGGAVLNAWIDFNGDGDFINDPTERVVFTKTSTNVINSQDAAIAESAAPVDYIFCFDVPADATFDGGETHVRFRLSKDGADYDGFAVGGEVEDYWIPFAKVGNYVWYDANHNGQQDEPTIEGHNDVTITLTWAGFDETIGTADDFKYTTVSATDDNGVKGKYCFLGLQGGETYSLEATVPDGFVTTKETTTGVDENDSNTPVIVFTMPDDVTNLPVGENGTEDNPGQNHGSPDNQDNLEFDFGVVAFDFGDLPDDFKSTTATGGAYHVINKGMYLGTCVDSDYDAVTDTDAGFDNIGGDDEAGSAYFEGTSTSDDEDGFRLTSPMIPGREACVEIMSTMPIGTDGIVNIFIDFNGDGDFENDPNESVYFTKVNDIPMGSNTNGTVTAGENVLTKFCFTVPTDATFEGGETHVRVRLSPSGSLSYTGEAIGGEVEDYYIPMAKVGSLAWLDYNDDGIQNEPDYAGYNGLKIELTAPGSDATLGTADDLIYDTYTADNDLGQAGTWNFCGLPEGDYQVEIFPEGLFPAKEGIGSEDQDSDPLVVPFTIGHTADGLFAGENGMNEDPNGTPFPDGRNLLSIDFGFLAFDFGDIPDGFETFLQNDGARHVVKSELFMGSCVDIEADAHTDYQGGEGPATGGDNGDPGLRTVGKPGHSGDEDGIRLLTPMIPGDTAVLEVRYSTPAGQDAYLNAFIDFDGDDVFNGDIADAVQFLYDENAHGRAGRLAGRGALEVTTNPLLPHGIDNTCKIKFLVPAHASFHGGDVHLRFRLSTEGGLDYNGIAYDGEVEDYWFPVACAGNFVWYDQDKEGDQNEAADLGMNDFQMYLETPGLDGIFGTNDDFKYYQNTTQKDGIDGRFDFCGLIEGTYRVGYDEYPDYMIPAIPDHVSDDNMDSGGLYDEFTISKYADNSPVNEQGMGDNMPDPNEFPDNQVTSNLDFGFIMDPVLGSALAIQGVDLAESGTCGQFNATYDMCIEAFEVTDVNNLRVTLDFDEANRLGDAFINLVKDPEVIESTATTLPTLNPNYDGANDIEMFDGMSGLMEKGQKICYRFTIEIDPDAVVNSMLAQAFLEGGAVNDSGVEVPDLVNGGQMKENDISDSGLDPSTTNIGFIGDTGGLDDATPVSDCWESSSTPACNDNVQVSLDGNGQATILGDHINEGLSAPCDDATLPLGGYYKIEIMDGNTSIGNTVDCRYIGQTLTVKSTHVVNCNPCWGTITIEDKWAPEITCGRDTVVDCTADLEAIGGVFATDNCDVDPVIQLVAEDTQIDECNETIIVKSYQATDVYGNASQVCQQTIRVLQAPVTFPDDVTWTCEQYAFNQGIVSATDLHPAILEYAAAMDLARLDCDANIRGDDVAGVAPYQAGTNWWTDNEDLDVTLDPRYDDNVDNPNTDTDVLCGTATSETDLTGYNLSLNVGCQYLDRCDTNPNGHDPVFVQVPIYDLANSPVEGLEDADILELTGSGVPNVMGIETGTCKFAVAFKDDILEACEGTGTSTTFKILRTWTVTNWCTGEILTDLQIIKVLDKKAPVISFAGFSNEISVDQTTGGTHQICSSSGIIDVPTVTDNCTGIANLQLQTPAGQGIPVYDNDGNITGFEVGTPYLEAGSHEVTYIATDYCGNTTTATAQIDVIDNTPPVAICQEITKVSLSTLEDGIATVSAEQFNAASYDNCSPIYFKVLKEVNESCANANIDTYVEENFSFRRSSGNSVPGFFEFFDDEVKFCCEEIGTTVKVRLRVYDVNPGPGAILTNIFPNQPTTGDYLGHINVPSHLRSDPAFKNAAHLNYRYNDCVVEVNIEDKSRPVCIAPADVWTTCSEVADNTDWEDEAIMNDLYGEANGYDNCSYDVEHVSTRVELDLCGVGNITRNFRTVDGSNNGSVGSCRQVIMIQPVTDYCITFPADFEGECDANYSPAELTYEENGCDLLAINKERTDFYAGTNGGECKKEFFTWNVINWCEYDGISAPVILSRDGNGDGRIDSGTYCSTGTSLTFESNSQISYTSTGFYTWEQHVKIFDNTAPVVSYDGDVVFAGGDLDENPCTGLVDISIDITEECTDQITSSWQLSAFSETFTNADYQGTGTTISSRYPLGTHTARFIVSDDCGNTSWEDVTFEIIDTKAPTPVCYNGLSVQLMPTGMVEVWASDFDASSFDYCHDIEVTANVVEDKIRDGVINSADYLTTAPTDKTILLTCDHVGITTVQLWVTELSDDGINQSDFCVTYVEVQDNNSVCGVSRLASIGGEVVNESGESIDAVKVQLSGDANLSQTTKDDGKYNIVNILSGGDYSIVPNKNDDIRNGVSTFDLALISKHVLNVELLNSPYKLIAADANKSGSITTLDLVAIRKVILWVSNEFPNNQSWRFVDKDFQFDNPNNPFGASFPESKNFNNLTSREMANFIGIKIGDVNGDAIANSLGSIEDRSNHDHFLFDVKDIQFEAGQEIEVAFNANDLKEMMGYQFTLHFNTKALELVEILDQSATQRNFGQTMIEDGILTASWNKSNEIAPDESTAFKFVFKTLNSGKLSELITIDSEYTVAEAYTNEGAFRNVGIDFGNKLSVNGFTLHQNQPNPFMGNTVIGFELPEATEATLTVTDILGKPIKTIKGNYSKGYNEVALGIGKESVGIYIYTLETPTHSATAKMKLIK